VYDLETTQAYLDSGVTGDELYALGASAGVILNNNITMDKDRYSVIEFDVLLIVTITQTIYIEFRLLYNRIYSGY
jgi:hypothetical protein